MKTNHLALSFLLISSLFLIKDSFCTTEVERIAWLLNGWDSVEDVEVNGDYAYLATRNTGLKIVDVSDPENPSCVGYCLLPGYAFSIALNNNILYVGTRDENGLSIVDISDPTDPQEICFIDEDQEEYSSNCLRIINGLAFFNDRIVDISDPDRPSTISIIPTLHNPMEVELNGDWLYYVDYSYGLKSYDVSNRHNPSLIGTCPFRENSRSMKISGNHAFVTIPADGIRIIDITNPREPHQVGEYVEEYYHAHDLEIWGDILYVIGRSNFSVFDVSDVTNPQRISSIDPDGDQMTIQDDIAYIAGSHYDQGLRLIDISDPENPSEISHITKNESSTRIDVDNQYAYIIGVMPNGHQRCWYVFDISRPDRPEIVSIYENDHQTRNITVRGDLAFVTASNHGLGVFDISNPDSIYETGRIEFDHAFHMSLNDSLAFVTTETYSAINRRHTYYGTYIIDYSDPENLEEVLFTEEPYYCTAVAGEELFVSVGESGNLRLEILDISDPSNPTLLSEYPTLTLIEDIALSDNHCFLATGEGGVGILNISDITEPRIVGFFNTPGHANKIRLEGSHLYISYYYNSLTNNLLVMDISDPAHPREVGYTNLPREIWDLTVSDGIAYLAELYVLEIYDCNPVLSVKTEVRNYPAAFTLFPAYPNPFNNRSIVNFELPYSGYVNVLIYDLHGRRINHFTLSEYKPTGRHSFNLNAEDLPSGNYLLRLDFGGKSKTRKITLIK